ncbi:hypothetical protein E4U55_006459 [Claviceps digitariae]|nr:hypothetical protein E4U55_006459 [Claviceps digitariae]
MSTVFSGQGHDEPTPPPSRADEKMIEQVESLRLGPSTSEHNQAKPRTQPTKKKAQQRGMGAPSSTQRHGPVQAHRQRPSQPHRPLVPLPSLSVFHPRSFEEIYTEQAYLSLTLQSHTSRLCDLLHTYHKVEADSIYGQSRKIKRRARRQVGILRNQIKHAADQEKTIYLRLSDLLLEAKSRGALDLAPQQHPVSRPPDPVPGPVAQPHPPGHPSASRLNGATAEFLPDNKTSRDQRADSGVGVFPDSDDEHGPRSDDKHYELSPHTLDASPMGDDSPAKPDPPPRRLDPRCLGAGHLKLDALMLRRQASMPNIRGSFLA